MRKARSQAAAMAAPTPAYTTPNPSLAVARARDAGVANSTNMVKANGEPMYVMQPVVSAGDKYRVARQNGEVSPLADAPRSGTQTNVVINKSDGLQSSIPLFLFLGLGLGTAFMVGDYDVADVAAMLGWPTAATEAASEVYPIGVEYSGASEPISSSPSVELQLKCIDHANVHKPQQAQQQPLWLQRHR